MNIRLSLAAGKSEFFKGTRCSSMPVPQYLRSLNFHVGRHSHTTSHTYTTHTHRHFLVPFGGTVLCAH
jgi:hypothetical protein